jgi:hypothetical protein
VVCITLLVFLLNAVALAIPARAMGQRVILRPQRIRRDYADRPLAAQYGAFMSPGRGDLGHHHQQRPVTGYRERSRLCGWPVPPDS